MVTGTRTVSRTGGLLVAAVAGVAALLLASVHLGGLALPANPFAKPPSGAVTGGGSPTSLATVTRRDLSARTEAGGTLGYAGSYSVVNWEDGILTSLPSLGQVIREGQVIYAVNGTPVVLLYGSTPAYRDLTGTAGAGPDIQELNADLVALGFVSASHLGSSPKAFTWWTGYGVEKLQAALGVDQTGTLRLGQAVFLPGAARITALENTLGAGARSGQPLMTASSTIRVVTVNLDASDQSELAVGDQVEVTLPNGKGSPGKVASVGGVAVPGPQGSSPVVPVLITLDDPTATGTLDQAPVDISITTATVKDALVVPVAALLAGPAGTYAVEVVDGGGSRHMVEVTLGLFDDADGVVQVTSSQLRVGDQVVVATT